MKTKSLFKNKDDVKIEVGNTSITIQPYRLGDIPNLEYRLSIYDNIYHRYNYFGLDYDNEKKKLYIPRTTKLETLENHYKLNNVIVKDIKVDPKTKTKFNVLKPPRDNVQIQTIDFLIGRDKFTGNLFYPRLLVSLDTGGGKTYCTLSAISQLGYRSAIIVPDDNLVQRWLTEIEKMTDMKKEDVYIIKGHKSIKHIKSKIEDKKIILISHRTIGNFGNKYGWEYVTKLFKKLKIGIKVYDEAHEQFKNIAKIDLHTNTEKTFYLTATASRSALKENSIFKTIFSNVPSLVITTKAREENHINMLMLMYNSMPTFNSKTRCKTMKGFSSIKYMEYCTSTGRLYFENAMEVAMNTILSNKNKGRILILLGTINTIFYIKGYLEEAYPSLKDDIGIYCSAVSKKEKDTAFNDKNIILSTFKSLGTGSDIENLKYIIMAEPYSSKVIASQCPGRLRNKGWYIELIDKGFNDCERQFESRKKTLIRKANKFKIVNM